MQDSLFTWGDGHAHSQQPDRQPRKLRVMITVTAASNPSSGYGETVCVAGLEVGVAATNWVRLYPVNLRHLVSEERIRKDDIIEVDASPTTSDSRLESWKPDMSSLRLVSRQKNSWSRRSWIDPVISPSMCALQAAVKSNPTAPSLALLPGNRKGTNPGAPGRPGRTRRTAFVLVTAPRVLNSTARNSGPPFGTKRPQVQILSPRPLAQGP